MARIAYVKAWGLWSHLESVFEFSPGLTVITGLNGSGKSSLIRIVRWVATGEPSGENFIFTLRDEKTKEIVKQSDEGRAEIGLDNGVVITKTRRKGKTIHTISTNPEPYEKAETPQEIKEALGIKKYSFGDYDTYLNFAFQMESPFLLSESPSVGAKLLGKLAGTEVVDLAIAEVSKRTHKARDEKRTAEKEIERINGDLLDYQDLHDLKAQLEAAEFILTGVETAANKRDLINTLGNQFTTHSDAVKRLTKELNDLQVVTTIEEHLKAINEAYTRYELLKTLTDQESALSITITETTSDLLAFQGINEAGESLGAIEIKDKRLTSIISLSTQSTTYTQIINNCQITLNETKDLDVASANLLHIEKKCLKLGNIKMAYGEYTTAESNTKRLTTDLQSFTHLQETDLEIKKLETLTEKLESLKILQRDYMVKHTVATTADTAVKQALQLEEQSTKELAEAWEACGGICPLCDQGLENHKH